MSARIPAAFVLFVCLMLAGEATSAQRSVYVRDPLGGSYKHPSRFAFSVNGDLAASRLRWKRWGQSAARARGYFTFTPRPAGSSPSVILPGKLSLRGIVSCGGRAYYSRATITLDNPGRAPWKPLINITPC